MIIILLLRSGILFFLNISRQIFKEIYFFLFHLYSQPWFVYTWAPLLPSHSCINPYVCISMHLYCTCICVVNSEKSVILLKLAEHNNNHANIKKKKEICIRNFQNKLTCRTQNIYILKTKKWNKKKKEFIRFGMI